MRKNKVQVILFILLMFCLSGCAFHTHMKGIEPYARPLEDKEYKVLEESEGKSSSFHLLWALPVTVPADYKEAVDQAINDKGGDNLIDVQYYHEQQYWIVGKVDILYVKGKVIRYLE